MKGIYDVFLMVLRIYDLGFFFVLKKNLDDMNVVLNTMKRI